MYICVFIYIYIYVYIYKYIYIHRRNLVLIARALRLIDRLADAVEVHSAHIYTYVYICTYIYIYIYIYMYIYIYVHLCIYMLFSTIDEMVSESEVPRKIVSL